MKTLGIINKKIASFVKVNISCRLSRDTLCLADDAASFSHSVHWFLQSYAWYTGYSSSVAATEAVSSV